MNEIEKSKVYRLVMMIVNIGLLLSLMLSAAFIVMMLAYPETLGDSGMIFDGIALFGPAGKSMYADPLAVIMMIIFLVSAVSCIFMLRMILNSLRKESPFTPASVRRIRLMGLFLLTATYARQFANYIWAKGLSALPDSGPAVIVQAHYTLLPEGAVLALIIFLLAEVFRFGCILQHEHDTTV